MRRGRFSGGTLISVTVALVPSGTEVRGWAALGMAQATSSGKFGMGSTSIESASFALIPNRALHTWQIKLPSRLSSLTSCSSQNPISRNRFVTSTDADSFLMHTTVPASTRLNGHTKGWAHLPCLTTLPRADSFIATQLRLIETWFQEGFSPLLLQI
jgi:hypothetical protein